MIKRQYELTIENDPRASCRKFIVIPKNYKRSWLLNWVLFFLANASVFWVLENYIPTTTSRKALTHIVFAMILLFSLRNPPIESFCVFRSIGVQISRMNGCILFPLALSFRFLEQTEFIPLDTIGDIIINEGFHKGFKVVFYIAVVKKESEGFTIGFYGMLKSSKDKLINEDTNNYFKRQYNPDYKI